MLKSASRGVSAPGRGCLLSGVCLLRGVSAPREGGVSAPREVSAPGGYIPACTEADTPPPPVDRQMPVKILPWPSFVTSGNKVQDLHNTSVAPLIFTTAQKGTYLGHNLEQRMLQLC